MVTLPLECIQARPVREKVPGAEDEPLDGGTGRVEDDAGVAHRRTPAFLAQGTGDGRRFPASRHVPQDVAVALPGGERSVNKPAVGHSLALPATPSPNLSHFPSPSPK